MAPEPLPGYTRRRVLCLAPAAMLYALGSREALAAPLQAHVFEGLARMNECSAELRSHAITPEAWQDQMAALVARLDLDEVVAALDLSALRDALELPDDRARARVLRFPELQQAMDDAGVRLRLFGLSPGRAIVPHGHHDLVSMHWVLAGGLHARHYDRVTQTRTHMVLRPTIDRVLRPGMATTVSDERDNVHWFVAVDGPAYSLGVTVSRLHDHGPHGRVYVDPRAAEREGDRLRAPILSPREARRRYGRG